MGTSINANQLQNGDEVGFYYTLNDTNESPRIAYGTITEFVIIDDDKVKFTVKNDKTETTFIVRNTFGVNLHS